MTPVVFIKEVQDELKKVTWPTQQEIVRLTLMVLIVSLIVGLYIGALDYIFTWIIQKIIK